MALTGKTSKQVLEFFLELYLFGVRLVEKIRPTAAENLLAWRSVSAQSSLDVVIE
jgi:hypothetical protein